MMEYSIYLFQLTTEENTKYTSYIYFYDKASKYFT